MKKYLTKITAFSLAFLVLFSTFSFTVEAHYCGDFIVDISYTGEAEVCKTDMTNDLSIAMKDCCSDEQHKIEGQDELQVNSDKQLDFSKQFFLTSFLTSYKSLFVTKDFVKIYHKNPYPPDTDKNFLVLYQTFLI